jgi:hypothetical protein
MFLNSTTYISCATGNAVAIDDMNNDMKPDIVIRSYNGSVIRICLNHGVNMFSDPITLQLDGSVNQFKLKDINDDEQPDIIVLHQNRLYIFYTDCDAKLIP